MSAKLEVKAIAKCIALQSCLAWIKLNRKSYAHTDNFMCAMICFNYFFFILGRDVPVYENDKLKNFCLVAVIGSRERCLRDDFKPLNLQNPWRSGKLFVRMKNDVLAALERINSSSRLRSADVSMSASTPNMAPPARTSTTTVL